jgi:endonuclease/exonuclease/phosphatase family metal-dependent hydrolase
MFRACLGSLATLAGLAAPALAQLRIVSYNTATAFPPDSVTAPPEMATIFQAIAAQSVNGIAKPIDVLLLQEQHTTEVTTQSFVDMLNGIYGAGVFERSTLNAVVTDFDLRRGGGPALVYNTQTVQLVEEIRFGPVNGSGQPRSTMRYRLRPMGYDAGADFYAYNNHYKAGDTTDDRDRRQVEAQSLRGNADALGDGTHIIYAGDFNVQSSGEMSFQTLRADGPGQAIDPINASGTPASPVTWNDNSAFRGIHTQDPDGPMDDRFDFQLVSNELLDSEGMSYITGSYRAFGNNGTHTLNSNIATGTGAASNVLTALRTASDHLPVVADYQLPARIGVQFGMFPTSTPVGSPASIDVLVQNIAAALTAGSVDELDYTISVTGDLLGGTMGTALPLAGANTHHVMLDTATPGLKSGLITVTPTSQGAAGGMFTLPVSYTVGANGSGELERVPVAGDDFDAPRNRLSFALSPPVGTYSSTRGFQRYQVGAGSVPAVLLDQTLTSNPSDTLGIIVDGQKTDGWFGVADTEDATENPTGAAQATWQFDVADVTQLEVSIDMGAIGDFEAIDVFNWTYALDGGAFQPLFTSSVDEAGSKVYALAGGNMATHPDPLSMTPAGGAPTELSNVLQTLTAAIPGVGDVLTLRLSAHTNGAGEAYAFDNIVVTGLVFFLDADFNRDGAVDGGDLAAWRTGVGTADGATRAQGDADNDGDVDGADFLIWQQQIGLTTSNIAASAAVPEPRSSGAALWASLVWAVSLRSRRLV